VLHLDATAPAPLRSFAEVQREGILRTLERTGWRVSGPKGAAAVLGLKPTTLESKMKKLGIRRPPR
jgi:transcriptional regulator with GAF, ATPase, and Fis domain